VSHGGVKESQLLLVVPEVVCPGGGFDHPDEEIRFGGEKEGVRREELVAQNPDQSHLQNLIHPVFRPR
jgi:hypothetical protein